MTRVQKREQRKKMFRTQRIAGVLLLLSSAAILPLSFSVYGEQNDRVALFITVPTGIYLLVSKRLILQ